MEITRNQFFMFGLVFLFSGIQFRMIESVELKEPVAKFLAERTNHPLISVSAQAPAAGQVGQAVINRVVRPPDWIGWLLGSLGCVCILHALAMPKSG